MTKPLTRILRAVHALEDWLLVVLLLGIMSLASVQVLLRNFFDTGITWADGAVRVLVLWIGLVGAMVASRYNKHITVDVLSRILPSAIQHITQRLAHAFTAAVCALIGWHGARMVGFEQEFGTTGVAGIPLWTLQLIIPIAFFVMALRYVLFVVLGAPANQFEAVD